MTQPQPSDYQQAIQAPRVCFKDAELKGGTVETTALGLPRAASGTFAIVYRMQCGAKSYAVRCFLTYFADQQRRYELICRKLNELAFPFMVGFEFQEQGILVNGNWFPILKMEWFEGTTLASFVEAHLDRPKELLGVARSLIHAVEQMDAAGISHCDLQHGNVLVGKDRSIRLIDYDGLFVPGLETMGSHELGHPNYQHPGRTAHVFGAGLDSFSAWVITASLATVAIVPNVWAEVGGGGEKLLFSKKDFDQPDTSTIFSLLEASPVSWIRNVGHQIRHQLTLPVSSVEPISQSALKGVNAKSVRSFLRSRLKGKTSPEKLVPTNSLTSASAVGESSWVSDQLAIAEPIRCNKDLLLPRLLVGSWVLLCASVSYAFAVDTVGSQIAVGIFRVATQVVVGAVCLIYLRRKDFQSKYLLREHMRELQRQVQTYQSELRNHQVAKSKLRKSERKALTLLTTKRDQITLMEANELADAIRFAHGTKRAAIDEEIAMGRKHKSTCAMELAQTERELERWNEVTFPNFVRAVFWVAK